MDSPGPVVLLTDFGCTAYVGVMKGVILGLCPAAVIVDLSHEVAPQDVRAGAWLLRASYHFFPRNSIFLAVVDPGVGTKRQALAIRAGDYYFVGPDNGLLFPAVAAAGVSEAVALAVPSVASPTFHGRDVFAPAAGRLAAGAPLAELGTATAPETPLAFHRRGREGEVVTIDHFGNVVTNLPPLPGRRSYFVTLERNGISYWQAEIPFFSAYAAAPTGALFMITGSSDTLELSVRNGRASVAAGIAPGDRISAE